MSKEKFKHYAIKTDEGFLAKDVRTNCLEIYEDEKSADKVVRQSKQNILVVPCYVYSEKEHLVIGEMYDLLQDVMKSKCCTSEFSEQISELLSKARGEL